MAVGSTFKYVGGTIFFIDSTADGTYTFYNSNGTQVSAPSVGTDCTGWTYEVSGASKDKFYVADLTNRTYLNRTFDGTYYVVWAAAAEDLSSYSASIDVLSSSNSTVGTGRRNSDWIKTNRHNSSYYPKTYGYREYCEMPMDYVDLISIWEIRDEANAAKVNGCSDWFCPSSGEIRQLRDYHENRYDTWQWRNQTYYGTEDESSVWSSSASTDPSEAWCWDAGVGNYYGGPCTYTRNCYLENSTYGFHRTCVLIRSF